MRRVNIGLLGCGTVGAGFVDLLAHERERIRGSAGVDLKITKILSLSSDVIPMPERHSGQGTAFPRNSQRLEARIKPEGIQSLCWRLRPRAKFGSGRRVPTFL